MNPRLRKWALIAHIISSVGWFGAVAAFLALAVSGLVSRDVQTVRGAYLAIEVVGWFVIVPLSIASLLTGLLQSLRTEWGLFRHYWIVVKFVFTIGATLLLLLHMQPTRRVAGLVVERELARDDLRGLRVQLVGEAGAALAVLFAATALSVFKPQGRTPFGGDSRDGSIARTPRWVKILAALVLNLLLAVILRHLAGGGHRHH